MQKNNITAVILFIVLLSGLHIKAAQCFKSENNSMKARIEVLEKDILEKQCLIDHFQVHVKAMKARIEVLEKKEWKTESCIDDCKNGDKVIPDLSAMKARIEVLEREAHENQRCIDVLLKFRRKDEKTFLSEAQNVDLKKSLQSKDHEIERLCEALHNVKEAENDPFSFWSDCRKAADL